MAKNVVRHYISNLWWLWLLTGVVSVLFGLMAAFMPGLTLVAVVQLVAFFVVVWGVFELILGLSKVGSDKAWWAQGLIGVAMVALGVFFARHLDLSVTALATLLGWVLVLRGVIDVAVGNYLDASGKSWWWLSAALGIIAGIVIWTYPVGTSVAFMWIVGLYAIVNGAVIIARAFEARSVYMQLVFKK